MIISSVTSTPSDYLITPVATTTTTNTAAIDAQIAQDAQAAPGTDLDAAASDAVDMAMIRAALDQRINQDVSSGTLSDSDAATVRLTLDLIDAQNGAQNGFAIQNAVQASGSSATQADNGADQVATTARSANTGATDDTLPRYVLTQTVTITGPLKITVTFYSDGTQETTTAVATPQDLLQYARQAADANEPDAMVMQYLSTIDAGTLFNQMA